MATKIMTAVGNAQLDTAQAKFGTASGLFDGTGDWVTTPDDAAWNLGTGKFTIDVSVQFNATGEFFIIGQDDAANSFWGLIASTNSTHNVTFASITAGTWDVNFDMTVPQMSTGTWYQLEIVRNGTTSADWYIFQNGTLGTNRTLNVGSYGGTVLNASSPLYIGGNAGGVLALAWNGWLDELRFSKGVARNTSNFTAPSSAYTTDASTDLLLHMDGPDGSTSFVDSSVAASGPNNVKTWDGVTQSTGIKTYGGVTLANTITWNGIA